MRPTDGPMGRKPLTRVFSSTTYLHGLAPFSCGSTDKRRREQTRDSGQDQSSPTPMPKMARPCVIKTLFVTTLHNAIA
jgi:hypothetical protein